MRINLGVWTRNGEPDMQATLVVDLDDMGWAIHKARNNASKRTQTWGGAVAVVLEPVQTPAREEEVTTG